MTLSSKPTGKSKPLVDPLDRGRRGPKQQNSGKPIKGRKPANKTGVKSTINDRSNITKTQSKPPKKPKPLTDKPLPSRTANKAGKRQLGKREMTTAVDNSVVNIPLAEPKKKSLLSGGLGFKRTNKITESEAKDMKTDDIVLFNKFAYTDNAFEKKDYPTNSMIVSIDYGGDQLETTIITKNSKEELTPAGSIEIIPELNLGGSFEDVDLNTGEELKFEEELNLTDTDDTIQMSDELSLNEENEPVFIQEDEPMLTLEDEPLLLDDEEDEPILLDDREDEEPVLDLGISSEEIEAEFRLTMEGEKESLPPLEDTLTEEEVNAILSPPVGISPSPVNFLGTPEEIDINLSLDNSNTHSDEVSLIEDDELSLTEPDELFEEVLEDTLSVGEELNIESSLTDEEEINLVEKYQTKVEPISNEINLEVDSEEPQAYEQTYGVKTTSGEKETLDLGLTYDINDLVNDETDATVKVRSGFLELEDSEEEEEQFDFTKYEDDTKLLAESESFSEALKYVR